MQNCSDYWCIPPKENAEFVACMEDILDIYERPYNGQLSVVCMDEKTYQLLGEVRKHRTAKDWAEEIRYLTDVMYPEVPKILLVMDNLNTHTLASLYKAYPAPEARRIAQRLDIHYTPKHGSWLDIAEIELNAMTCQCLAHRIDNMDHLQAELAAWECYRDDRVSTIHWHFTSKDAREKLVSLYPKFEENNPS